MRTVQPSGRLIADGGLEREEGLWGGDKDEGMNWELRCGV